MTDEQNKEPQVNSKARSIAILGTVALLAAGAIIGAGYLGRHHGEKAIEPCTAGPNERCPSDEWLKSYQEFQAAQAELKHKMESDGITDRQRTLAGWAQDLGKGIPTQEGYSFDEKSRKFVKPALPPAPPAPQPEPKK